MSADPMHPDDDDDRPLEARLPPPVVATPSDLRGEPAQPLVWWTPGWQDLVRHVGYRWVYLLPAAGLLLLLGGAVIFPPLAGVMAVLGVKLLVVVGALAITLTGYVIRRAVRARREPFCIHCGYNLSGLPDNYRCPECGRPYTWRLIAEYRRDPRWFIERYKARQKLPPAGPTLPAGPSAQPRRRDGP